MEPRNSCTHSIPTPANEQPCHGPSLSGKAWKTGALIFPNIVKAGFIVGAQYGDGALVKRKQGGGYYIDEYFSLAAASYGLQAGIQTFGVAIVLMSDAAVEHVETSRGWELGVGPSIVIVDTAMAKTLTS